MQTLLGGEEDAISRAVLALKDSSSVLVVTGAGLSADSGIPLYRGIGGLYNSQNLDISPLRKVFSSRSIKQNLRGVWARLLELEVASRKCKPGAEYSVLARMESRFNRFWVLTQNVDGFHRRSGSRNVIEIHGMLYNLRCTICSHKATVEHYGELTAIPPSCGVCGGPMRPGITMFDETLDNEQLTTYSREISRSRFDVAIAIGTSAQFSYITKPLMDTALTGKALVEINPERSMISDYATIRIQADARSSLQSIWSRLLVDG